MYQEITRRVCDRCQREVPVDGPYWQSGLWRVEHGGGQAQLEVDLCEGCKEVLMRALQAPSPARGLVQGFAQGLLVDAAEGRVLGEVPR